MHLGRPRPEPGAPSNIPLVLSSTFRQGGDLLYGRDGNPTWDQFVIGLWEESSAGGDRLLTVVNYGDTQAQCYVTIDVPALDGKRAVLTDLLGDARYERAGVELAGRGLYLDLPPWGRHAFELRVL